MKKSPLAEEHIQLGARMAGFAGWEMPIQYEGIVAEHHAVRRGAGVFDISHMGQFFAMGEIAGDWLNYLLTNDTRGLGDGEGQYTLMLNPKGGVIDDLIVYRVKAGEFLLVVNASKVEEDFEWMCNHLAEGITLENNSDQFGGLAVQGPESAAIWEKVAPGCPLPPRNGIVRHGSAWVCRTGYTGEDGFELFVPVDEITGWFQKVLSAGARPCGLGARDTLRLEKAYPLNGNDLDPGHTPLEAGLGFFVKLKSGLDFIGRSRLEMQKARGLEERLTAIVMEGKTPPPRHGYEVIDPSNGIKIGELTSGSLSPTLGIGIALAYLPVEHAKPGAGVAIRIRNRDYPAQVVAKPFVR